MPAHRSQFRGVEEIVFEAYFNRAVDLPSFILDFLQSNLLLACVEVGHHLVHSCQQLIDGARLPEPHHRSALNNLILA